MVNREMRNMYIRTNTLLRRFGKCSKKVKIRLFRSYCLCMYDTALWNTYTVNCMKKLRSCYHRCIKSFFGYDRLYSVTAILLELQLPSFDTLLYNYKFSFSMQFTCSGNAVVNYPVSIGIWCVTCAYVFTSDFLPLHCFYYYRITYLLWTFLSEIKPDWLIDWLKNPA